MASGPESAACGFILSVGDELIAGLTVDTNSAWLCRELAGVGIPVLGHATVGDDQAAIEEAIGAAAVKAELLIVTGGIGPTPDDLTREALAAVMKVPLVKSAPWIEQVEEFFRIRGRAMQPGNRKQAGIPQGATLLPNPIGTAAGVRATVGRATVFVLPGVPAEMIAMFGAHVLPWAGEQARQRDGRIMRTRCLQTFGLGESDIAARLGDLLRRRESAEGVQVGTTASGGVVSIRAYAAGRDEAEVEAKLGAVEREARQKLGEVIFGRDDETLAGAAARLLRQHPERPVLRVAESCTGGLLGKMITDVAGSSDYFDRGFISYANEAKVEMLGVPRELIEQHGAVSEEVAEAMVRGALQAQPLPRGRACIALSITGIAGPGGGTEQKPVGTVCIGLAARGADLRAQGAFVAARTFRFVGNRDLIRQRSALMALSMLRYHLLGAKMPF